jgi:carbonic anhydrase
VVADLVFHLSHFPEPSTHFNEQERKNIMTKTRIPLLLVLLGLIGNNQFVWAADPDHADQPIVPPTEAISQLKQGNERYTRGNPQHPHESIEERTRLATNSYENASLVFPDMTKRREELAKSQHPFAVVLGCSDSRVPPEIVFDQGLGDLFVLRVAGNVVDDHSLGSIEYAVDHLTVRLIVVLGHQRCGAVKAAKETIAAKGEAPAHIQSLVTAIQPAVEATVQGDLEATVRENVKNVVQALRSSAPVLKAKVDSGELKVVGAYYSLDTGSVAFPEEK